MRKFAVAAIAASALIVGGGVAFVLSTSGPSAMAVARTAYIAAHTKETAASVTTKAALDSLGSATTIAQLAADLAPAEQEAHTFQTALEAISWPSSVHHDANTLIGAVGTFVWLSGTASVQTASSLSKWAAQLVAAGRTMTAALARMNRALGVTYAQ